jgi:preprotein translocase subunit SecG
MLSFLVVLIVIAAILLVIIVLAQNPKEGRFSSRFLHRQIKLWVFKTPINF